MHERASFRLWVLEFKLRNLDLPFGYSLSLSLGKIAIFIDVLACFISSNSHTVLTKKVTKYSEIRSFNYKYVTFSQAQRIGQQNPFTVMKERE